jgi:hypothetical protein
MTEEFLALKLTLPPDLMLFELAVNSGRITSDWVITVGDGTVKVEVGSSASVAIEIGDGGADSV